jgi:type IV pilus assembly protein PilQ
VDFRDTPIEDVIKSLAQQADIDIVKGPNVTGTVTATLTDVPLDEAMESILTVHGFGYTTSESIVWIVPKSEVAQYMVKFQTKIYHVDYADVETLDKALKEMLSPQGQIAVNEETGHLCITDTGAQIKMFDSIIEEMDRETPQILVEAKIYDVSSSVLLDLGFDWSAGTATVYDPSTGAPISGKLEPFTMGAFGSNIKTAPSATGVLQFGVINNNVNIDATLKAARDDVKARLLANPKILVLDGREAKIDIVSEIPYQELTQTSGGGNIGTTKFKEVGVTLQVTPRITRDDKIRLTLRPTFSIQTGTVNLVIPTGLTAISSPQPIVDKREAQTYALIGNGQTVVIGGLRKRDVVQNVSRVPLLSDIPLLGELFKFRGDKTVNSELVVFITPHIIAEPKLTSSDTRKLKGMDEDLREPEPPKLLFDSGTPISEEGDEEQ